MAVQTKIWGGDEWQKHSLLLLNNHYKPGEFQEVPDRVKGDFGIEGFSIDGRVYQCYASQEYRNATKLYEDQRDKMTRDLKKFTNNRTKLSQLFNDIKVKRWIFLVPTFDDKRLTVHAADKTHEVRSLVPPLPYVDDDFRVVIVNDDSFAVTRQSLVKANSLNLWIPDTEVESSKVDNWLVSSENTDLVTTLERKALKLGNNEKEYLRHFRDQMLKHFLEGQNALHYLQTNYPEMYVQCNALKMQREEELEIVSGLSDSSPKKMLLEEIDTFKETLKSGVPGIGIHCATLLTWEAVADWLLRCPLDFVEANNA